MAPTASSSSASASPPKPPQFALDKAIRSNILALLPYRCARDDYSEGVLLDANENALGHALPPAAAPDAADAATDAPFDDLDLHRYPSPTHYDVKQRLCQLRNVPSVDNFFLGVGSDEVIDLLYRIACVPAKDRVLVCPPTYGMYGVCAQINDVEVVKVNLDVERGAFRPRVDEVRLVLSRCREPLLCFSGRRSTEPALFTCISPLQINRTLSEAASSPNPIKLVFLCSPGNPTGTLISLDDIRAVLSNPDYQGLVVVDEAYIDFAGADKSAVRLLVDEGWSNLVVMQTLSKGFGLAAIRWVLE